MVILSHFVYHFLTRVGVDVLLPSGVETVAVSVDAGGRTITLNFRLPASFGLVHGAGTYSPQGQAIATQRMNIRDDVSTTIEIGRSAVKPYVTSMKVIEDHGTRILRIVLDEAETKGSK